MQFASAPHAVKFKGKMNNLVHPTATQTTMKALTTAPASSTAPKPPTVISRSGSAALRLSVPSGENPPFKVPFTKYSPTPDDTPSSTKPVTILALTPINPPPLAASPIFPSHFQRVQRAHMSPGVEPLPLFRSYPSRGAIVPTPSTLPHHSRSLVPQVEPGRSSKGQLVEGPMSAKATMARNTIDQTVLKTLDTNFPPPTSLAGAKRRLGMGRPGAGYVSKRKKARIDGVCTET